MKRWMIYLLVLVGVHIYYFSVLNNLNEPHREEMKRRAAPTYTVPNWSNPIQGDIFMVKDTDGVIRYYKIIESLDEGNLSLRTGKYQFSTDLKEQMTLNKWNFEFMNDPKLYADSISHFSLDEFKKLKDGAYFTRGFRLQWKKNAVNIFLYLNNHYFILIKSLICFFIIWLFGFCNSYLSALLSYSKEVLLIIFIGSILFFIPNGALIYVDHFWIRIYIFGRILAITFLIFYLVNFLKKKWIRPWNFADQEAAKFMVICLCGFSLSCLIAYLQFVVVKNFDIDYFIWQFDKSSNWVFHLMPFNFLFWLSIATGNFLNNFRKHFFLLRRKAKAFKYARQQELEFKSELETLQAKINPHFLYNSLNSIASLAQSDPVKTETMALALSKFYKEKTNRKENLWSTVAEEMDMLKTYLAIEKIRFGDRMQIELFSNENADAEKLPRFLLQPLIENAIKYGYNATDNKITVKVFIEKSNRILSVRIIDSGPEFSDQLNTGYGIRSVQKKLKLFYPGNHKMEFINKPEKQILIQIKC